MIPHEDLTGESLQIEALLVARSHLYELFGKVLGGRPDADVISAVLSPATADAIEEYAKESATMRGLLGFLQALSDSDTSDLVERAADEYTRVLIGPGALPASPYESPYTGTHDMSLFQQNTLDVREAYHEAQLRLNRELRVPDDHVAALCGFMSVLAQKALDEFLSGNAAVAAETLRRQDDFANRHLSNWLGTYAACVRNSKAGENAVLYPQMLEALASFVDADIVFMGEAAYWLEGDGAGPAPSLPRKACSFPNALTSLDALVALRPYGIEDCELVAS